MHNEPTRKGSLVSLTDGTLTEAEARAMLERIRWPERVRCIFEDCGGADVYRVEVAAKTYPATATRKGRTVGARSLYKCKSCRRQFSVTKGTIFEDSKIPLRTWIVVMYRMCSSKKGVSALQIQREFGLSYESAWFMCHRIRYAMQDKSPKLLSGTVEADETYVGGKVRGRGHGYRKNKTIVFGMVERDGNARTHVVPDNSGPTLKPLLHAAIDTKNARLMTDEWRAYNGIEKSLPHGVIRHKSEYARGDIHTNTIESYWAILKRGLIGVYHNVDAGYLPMYASEFEFRYNRRKVKDAERFASLLGQVEGRLDWYLPAPESPSTS
ncbi:MAG: IS1595 family transposase [Dehalococcoidia bacterium]|nr:IS1595 family transposase [Dehalococcoidia bacterium]